MNYSETVDYLFNQLPVFQVIGAGAYKPGLQNAKTLAEAFDNPQNSFKSIHVAGTNGKGSTSHMLASVLGESGLKVGLFTSPHIYDFRERIRINGEKISEEYVVKFVERFLEKKLNCSPSFFELTTIMAFEYFKSQGVDIAVIEVGLGGRLDTTNIITPLISVVTNVSLDHTELLGDTEKSIAEEKAGIIKPNIPVVIGESKGDVRKVFEEKAKECQSPIIFADDNFYTYQTDGERFIFEFPKNNYIHCELQGFFQKYNINTVLHVLQILGYEDINVIRQGLENVTKNTGLIGRWSTKEYEGRTLITDTGHNIGAWKYLSVMLHDIVENGSLSIILGFSNDKDIQPIFQLLPQKAKYYFVKPSVKRGRDAENLRQLAEKYGICGCALGDVMSGFHQAMQDSTKGDTIFVGGSNFVVADLKIDEIG